MSLTALERTLDRLFRLCGAVAAGFIAAIGVLIVSEVILRFFGMTIPGVIELATFSLLAATFLALAQTLRKNEHVRITMAIRLLPARFRRWAELWCMGVSGAVFAVLGWHTAVMAIDSYMFNEKSDGVIGFPLWVPQTIMVVGVAMLALVFIEEFVKVIFCDRTPVYIADAAENPELDDLLEFSAAEQSRPGTRDD